MTPDRWEEIKKMVRSNFTIQDEYEEDLEPGSSEVIEFDSPHGLLQLRFVKKPKLLDTKTAYSHRVGADINISHVYSTKDTVTHLEVYKYNADHDEWQELETPDLFS